MARQRGITVENNFIQGLITETPALSFPEKACTETYDCVFSRTGKVSRRLGFSTETGSTSYAVPFVSGQATTEYLWTAVGGLGTKTILVVQQADKLFFYNVSNTASISPQQRSEVIDLDSYLPAGSSKVPAVYPCSFAQGNGDLLICNEAISPIYVSYSAATDSLAATAITVQFRDFVGLTSEVSGLTTRTAESVSSLKSGKPKHYYNLLNQGWYANDALSQWDTARTDMPSMADVPSLYRSSETDSFDPTKVGQKDPGNVPAPKGHFILTAWNHDRTTAMTNEGFTGATIGTVQSPISAGSLTTILNSWSSPSTIFDGTTLATSASASTVSTLAPGTNATVGKTLSTATKIAKAIVHGTTNSGFCLLVNPTVTLTLYGKQGAAPAHATDGTLLGTTSFTDATDESAGRTITSSDTTTFYDHVWVNLQHANSIQTQVFLVEVVFYTITSGDADTINTTERPSCNAFFAGRAWYAGINAQGVSNNIYFSQIIERKEQYGYCYQANDPAGEYFNDLLVNDGGVIKILEMGSVVKLFATRSALFVFATNGIWQISGSSGAGFKATDYVVRRISNVGTVASLSFVDFKGLPMWWAEDGIYAVAFDPQTESFTAQNVTLKSIKTFYTDIPTSNRKYAKGAYDPINDYVYWVYNSGTPYHNYDYNRVLVMNGTTGAFFPWTISPSTTHGIRGVCYVIDPSLATSARIKYVSVTAYSGSSESVTFAEASNTSYTDWPTAENTSYSSFFVTGYKIHGDTQRFTQANYVFVFLDQETDASLFMRFVFDFTNSGDSGKWSTAQQCYKSSLTSRDVNFRRLKVRGKGRAMQLKFYSESGKPFTCIGWSLNESQNSDI